MNLAWAELYRLMGALLSRFEMELVDTTEKDIRVEHYCPSSMSSLESNGIRIRITKVLDV